jgi:hypothetical protein
MEGPWNTSTPPKSVVVARPFAVALLLIFE